MKNIAILLALFLLIIGGCKDTTTSPDTTEKGSIPLSFSLAPLTEMNVEVTSVDATVTLDDESITRMLTIEEDQASGTISNLNPGVWSLLVQIYAGDYVVAEGTAEVEVLPGQESEVQLTLQINDVTGSITIVVDWNEVQPTPQNILFLGNSYTYYNGGLDMLLENFAESSITNLDINVEAITGGGLALENHYNNQNTMDAISSGDWDYVILQGQSQMTINDPDLFIRYATAIDSVIDISGAQTCLFMTWAREWDQRQIDQISSVYLETGAALDATVVPVGFVFNYVFEDNHDVIIYSGDGSHPSIAGSYLATACFYTELFNGDPTDAMFVPDGVTQEDAIYIVGAVRDWFNSHPLGR